MITREELAIAKHHAATDPNEEWGSDYVLSLLEYVEAVQPVLAKIAEGITEEVDHRGEACVLCHGWGGPDPECHNEGCLTLTAQKLVLS